MKSILTIAVLIGFVMVSMSAVAEEKAAAPAAACAVTAVKAATLDLTGKIAKEVKKEGDKEVVSYCLETKECKIALPAGTKMDEKLVGKECKLVVEGEKTKGADGKQAIKVNKVVKCEEVKAKEAAK